MSEAELKQTVWIAIIVLTFAIWTIVAVIGARIIQKQSEDLNKKSKVKVKSKLNFTIEGDTLYIYGEGASLEKDANIIYKVVAGHKEVRLIRFSKLTIDRVNLTYLMEKVKCSKD